MRSTMPCFLAVLGFACIVIMVNVGVDRESQFRQNREKQVAGWLLAGHHVANYELCHERKVAKELIASGKKAHTLVLGSNRGFQLDQSLFPQHTFYNYSLTRASFQDFFAVTGLLKHHGALPKRIVWVLDPWLFNENNHLSEWVYWADDYTKLAYELRMNAIYAPLFQEKETDPLAAFDPTYFAQNLDLLFETGSPWVFRTAERSLPLPIKLVDGSLAYPEGIRGANLKEVFAKAERMAYGKKMHMLEDYKEISKVQVAHMEKLMVFFQQNHVEVLVYLPPFNPIVWGKIQNDHTYHSVLECEKYLRFYCKKIGVPIMGSYNPHEMFLDPDDFYDGIHLSREATLRYFRHGVKARPSNPLLSSARRRH